MTSLTRRHFLKISAAGTATVILAGCDTDERWVELEPYVQPPLEQISGIASWYATSCRQCPAGCGIIARVMNGRAVKLEGNPEHPVNRGRLCARGQSELQVLYHPDRVTGAVFQAERGSREYEPVAWNEAINTLYERLNEAGSRVAVWLGSSTSDHLYDLFRRFTEAIGAPAPVRFDLYSAINGYSALSSASAQMLGRSTLPAYDLGRADMVFSFGADFVGSWLSTTGYSVEYGRFRSQPNNQRGYLVHFEPRMSPTGAAADQWLPIVPGSEALVAQAIARLIADGDTGSAERIERAAALAGEIDLEAVPGATGVSMEQLERLARLFARAERPLALPGSPLTGQPNAAQAIAAVQMLNVIVGAVGQPGGMSLSSALPEGAPAAAPISTFADVQALLGRINGGEVDVLLVHGANPAYELPPGAGFTDALQNVGYVVSFNPLVDETAVWADAILPDRTPLESWGYNVVTPTFQGVPVISSQQPVVTPLYDVRPTGDVLLTVARGIPAAASALPWTDEVAYLQEVVAGLPAGAQGGDDAAVRWARFLQHGGWWTDAPTGEEAGAEAPEAAAPITASAAEFQGDAGEYPYFLHLYLSPLLGDGSGAAVPWLQGTPDPMTTVSWRTWVEINPRTAEELGLSHSDVVRITSPHGEIEASVYVYPAIRPDTIAIPFGQGHEAFGRYARNRGANPLRLVGMDAGEDAASFNWANLRVKIERTGSEKALARFESTIEPGEHAHLPLSYGAVHERIEEVEENVEMEQE
jgi:anaerobic selenocysteine-containing dehydrogenase